MPYVYQIVTIALQDRLAKVIQERLIPGADKAQVIWDVRQAVGGRRTKTWAHFRPLRFAISKGQ